MMNYEKLCQTHQLGCYQAHEPVTGGLLHKMFRLITNQGVYAIKILNPEIMQRPHVEDNITRAESFGRHAVSAGIAGIPAWFSNDQCIFHQAETAYMVYDWLEGETYYDYDAGHAYKIGELLRSIHALNMNRVQRTFRYEATNWEAYNSGTKVFLKDDQIQRLKDIESQMLSLDSIHIMSHRDMDQKNVMWLDQKPYLIDWEASDLIDPGLDFLVCALYWSFQGTSYDEKCFKAFVKGYGKQDFKLDLVKWHVFNAKIGWLKYCLTQATRQADQASHVLASINEISITYRYMSDFDKWLKEIDYEK